MFKKLMMMTMAVSVAVKVTNTYDDDENNKKLFSNSDCVNYLLLLFVTVLFQTQLGSSLFSVKIQSINVNINIIPLFKSSL